MNRTTAATRTVIAALAALLTLAMFATTSTLARHQYRVAQAAHQGELVAANAQHVVIVGKRIAAA